MRWHERSPAKWSAEQRIASELLDDVRAGIDGTGQAYIDGLSHKARLNLVLTKPGATALT